MCGINVICQWDCKFGAAQSNLQHEVFKYWEFSRCKSLQVPSSESGGNEISEMIASRRVPN